ncbi:DoxX family protein [Candidatus Woesearchaeota archaeon]|nr:DoxX family protein [Candidatus Woesearchaeota archaeon]
MKQFMEKNANYFYFVFRIVIGLLFMLHGISKIQGLSSGKITLVSLMGLAMIIEVVGGVMIILGLLTRYVSLITAVEMIVAYFKAHIPQGINPLTNGGEPAVLFFAAFLVLLAYGAGKWSLDSKISRE